MTIRNEINTSLSRSKTAFIVGTLIFIVSMSVVVTAKAKAYVLSLTAVGFATCLIGIIYYMRRLAVCPECNNCIYMLTISPNGNWLCLGLHASYKHCPFCGTSLDAESRGRNVANTSV